MKKLIVLFSMMFFIMGSAFAQKGIQAAGVHLTYGTEIESFGIGVKYQYNITDNIRLEPSMNYFFENKGVDQFDLNANVHYLFPMASNIRVYPLAGLTFARWDGKGNGFIDDDVTRLGVNVGGGAEMDITDKLMLNFELKYQFVSDFDQAIFNIGIAYMF
ncbi:MAG: porin family protein [Bacteroides sp.]|nr:porin family protein [Bacteroides sp.]